MVILPRGLDFLHRPPGCIFPDRGPSRVSLASTLLPQETCLSFQGFVLWAVHSSASLHQSLRSGFGVGASEGLNLLQYLDNWLVVAESRYLLLHHLDLLLQLCADLGIVVNWQKSDLVLSTRLQYLGMVIHTSLERVFPSQDRLVMLQGGSHIFSPSFSTSAHVAGATRPYVISRMFSSGDRKCMRPLHWQMKDNWSSVDSNPIHLS